MGAVLEVSRKIHFGPLTFKITQIIRLWCLIFFQIQNWYKNLFLVPR